MAVVTEQVKHVYPSADITVSGNVEGSRTVRLGFTVAGRINSIHVAEGQKVKQGQLIAGLDPVNYEIARELADIQVRQVADEFDRLKAMHERRSLSESDFRKADFTLQGARAQLRLHDKNLADTKLYAPISGILLKKLAEPGEIVATGTPILVVSDISKVKVNAYIPENQLSQVRIGQTASVRVGALGETYSGKVTEVGAAADVTTRAFTIKVEVPNPKQDIRPGMIAEVALPSEQGKQMLAVPVSAIRRTPEGQTYVFVTGNGQAFQRNISIGAISGDKVEVLAGLSAGEAIVTGGQQKLTNGSRISVTNPSPRR